MFIIWGFRNKFHDHGPTIAATCPRCHNSVVLSHVQTRRWFTVFFLPLIPLGKGKRVLMCPICRWGRDVPKEAEGMTAEMVDITHQWQSGGLTDDAYGQRVAAYWELATPGGAATSGSDIPSQ